MDALRPPNYVSDALPAIARASHGQEDQMKTALHIVLLALLACCPARAQEYEYGTALLCDSQKHVERYVALFKGKEQAAIDEVNTEEQDPDACGLATVAFIRGPQVTTARNRESAFRIVRILVVGMDTPAGIRPVQPAAYFTVFEVVEYDV
jgi:hypothetical protein